MLRIRAGLASIWVFLPFLFIHCDGTGSSGSLDTSFGGDGMVITAFAGGSHDEAYAVTVQSDGKVLVAGRSYNGADFDFAVARYDSSGNLDTTFSGDGMATVDFSSGADTAYGIAVQSDGRILLAGVSSSGGSSFFALARLTSSGTLDTDFDTDGRVMTTVGTLDEIRSVALTSDGKIVVAGKTGSSGSFNFALARYLSSGALDTSFSSDGKMTHSAGTGDDIAYAVTVLSDGRIEVAGAGEDAFGEGFALARFTSSGAMDSSFAGTGSRIDVIHVNGSSAYGIGVTDDFKTYAFGSADTGVAAARYTSAGQLDATYGSGGYVTGAFAAGNVSGLGGTLDSSENAYAVGAFSDANLNFSVVTFGNTGSINTSYGTTGIVEADFGSDDTAYTAVKQSDGKLLVVGRTMGSGGYDFAIARFNY